MSEMSEPDVIVIGPECFADAERRTICWKGINYVCASQLLTEVRYLATRLEKLCNENRQLRHEVRQLKNHE